MKSIYLNAREVGNFSTRLVIKNLYDQQNSDLFFIVEPMIPYVYFPTECFKQIKLKRFALTFTLLCNGYCTGIQEAA